MATPSGNMLMDLTDAGRAVMATVGIDFVFSDVAYGEDGYDVLNPDQPTALNPAATTLGTEIYRKAIPASNVSVYEIVTPIMQRQIIRTSVGTDEFTGVLGEVGLFVEITDPGSGAYTIGEKVLFAHAHFPRVCFNADDRLAHSWPIEVTKS